MKHRNQTLVSLGEGRGEGEPNLASARLKQMMVECKSGLV